MLRKDRNKYIKIIYNKSVVLNGYSTRNKIEDFGYTCDHSIEDESNSQGNIEKINNEEGDRDSQEDQMESEEIEVEEGDQDEIQENEESISFENQDDSFYEKNEYTCKNVAQQFNKSVLREFLQYKASDVYLFEKDPVKNVPFLTNNEKYIPYPRKKYLKYAILKVMLYQKTNDLIDYHPSIDDLKGDLKKLVSKEMNLKQQVDEININDDGINDNKAQLLEEDNSKNKIQNTNQVVKIKNIIHQSLQSFNTIYCKSPKLNQIQEYFQRCKKNKDLDQWGKQFKTSPSQFLWLPSQFVYNNETKSYQIEGKLFEHLEQCPYISELKDELSNLMTYISVPLKETHKYFKKLNYNLMSGYDSDQVEFDIYDCKKKVDFSQRIHAIVKISEMEIQPNSVYNGQWHVEGFSSDNILYTCLYVIEQDQELTKGKLLFKRASRADDVPCDPMEQEQQDHSFCPDYEYLCDRNNLIPLGQLGLKEDLMVIFPNQNIHRVTSITNKTNKPLKRKIVAFFIVNHVDQPFTVNDVEFTQPLSVIKEHRLLDMFERSKNKQTNTQSFNYCEH